MITKEIHAAVDRMISTVKTRLVNAMARAVVELVNDGTKMQSVQASVLDSEVRDTERVQEYGFSSVPQPGAECVVLFPNGDRQNGMIIATDDRRYRPTGGQPGEVMLYTDEGVGVKLARGGQVLLGAPTATSPVTLATEIAALKAAIALIPPGGPCDPVVTAFAAWIAPGATKVKAQ